MALIRTKIIAVLVLFLACFTGLSCEKPLNGKYEDYNRFMAIEFKDGKAYITTLGATMPCEYRVTGDQITIRDTQSGELILTRNKEGSLIGPSGMKLDKRPQ